MDAATAACVLALLLAGTAAGLQVVISPRSAHLNMAGDNLTVVCVADRPIVRCQFKLFTDDAVRERPVIDLSRGGASTADTSLLNDQYLDYHYVGGGLEHGQCGIRLRTHGWKRSMLGCRVRADTGGWKYGIMSFTADQSQAVPVTVSPEPAMGLPGSSLSVLCKAPASLEWCRMDLPGTGKGHIFLDQGADSKDSTPDHRYFGAGLDKGECGVTLPSLSEEWNGFAFCGVVTKPGFWQRVGFPVVVARPPSLPELEVTSDQLYEGAMLEARCVVSGGRPQADISWLLGDELIRSDAEDDAPDDVWRWPISLQRTTQRLRRRLRAQDDGKQLQCRAQHPALQAPLVASKTIRFAFSKVCPGLQSDTMSVSCHMAGEPANCSLPQPVGSVADLRCRPGHLPPPDVAYRRLTCLRGGRWNRVLYACHPDCGRRKTNTGAVLVSGGIESKIGEFPWHIAVYQRNPGGEMKHICGGTLISSNIVVSAAHCYWDSQMRRPLSGDNFKVAAGKQLRQWEEEGVDPAVQTRVVQQVLVHTRFRGRETNFAADVALLRVDKPFDITARVNLICIDWDNSFESRQLAADIMGVAAGWGFTESGSQSDQLMYINLPFVPANTCLDALPSMSLQLLTPDKFCAGFANRSISVCRGDSGGGLVFRDPPSDKYYLRGIVSIAFPPPANAKICYSELYTGFTKFSQVIPWVQDNI